MTDEEYVEYSKSYIYEGKVKKTCGTCISYILGSPSVFCLHCMNGNHHEFSPKWQNQQDLLDLINK